MDELEKIKYIDSSYAEIVGIIAEEIQKAENLFGDDSVTKKFKSAYKLVGFWNTILLCKMKYAQHHIEFSRNAIEDEREPLEWTAIIESIDGVIDEYERFFLDFRDYVSDICAYKDKNEIWGIDQIEYLEDILVRLDSILNSITDML